MKATLLRTSTLLAISFCALLGAAQAQTPVLKEKPSITLKWLGPLTVKPTTVRAGTGITGTVRLLRPAIKAATVDLELKGPDVGEAPWVGQAAHIPTRVVIEAGVDHAVFSISTLTGDWTGSRTYTVVAKYAGETKSSAPFTVTR
jgi:hypothetical protein